MKAKLSLTADEVHDLLVDALRDKGYVLLDHISFKAIDNEEDNSPEFVGCEVDVEGLLQQSP